MNMKTVSGMVSIFTNRISGGMSASSGLKCASSMSMRVSNRMYAHVIAKSSLAFVRFKPRLLSEKTTASVSDCPYKG